MQNVDDSIYEFVGGSGGADNFAPVEDHWAEFVGIEPMAGNPAEGKRPVLRFKWKVTDGDHAGKLASALCDVQTDSGQPLRPTDHNKLGRFLKALAGVPKIEPGVSLNVKSAVGKKYVVKVEPGKQGGKPSVTSVMKPPG
jgi:hypothetical protein